MTPSEIRARPRRLAVRASGGFTLIEVMMAMALTVVIMASAGALLYAGQKVSTGDTEDATAQSEAQGQLDRMIRDLRGATDVKLQNPGQVTITQLDGTALSYKCDSPDLTPGNSSYNACYRLTGATDTSLSAPSLSNLVIPRLNKTPATVFGYTLTTIDDSLDSTDEAGDAGNDPGSLAPVYITVHIELPANGELKTTTVSGVTSNAGRSRTIVLDSGTEMRNIRYAQSGGAGS